MDELEQRVVELETRVAFQEHALNEMSDREATERFHGDPESELCSIGGDRPDDPGSAGGRGTAT